MQQRFKLALTIYSNAELYVLDEPTNFLDDYWKEKVGSLISSRLVNKTLILASNVEEDFRYCDDYIFLESK
jgi:ABC-type multidrug transport system ATPase subunit